MENTLLSCPDMLDISEITPFMENLVKSTFIEHLYVPGHCDPKPKDIGLPSVKLCKWIIANLDIEKYLQGTYKPWEWSVGKTDFGLKEPEDAPH